MAFQGLLKQSTAVDILIGPFVDDTDGKTAEAGLTLDVELSKNGQGLANKNDATVPVADSGGSVDGYYNCELDATDTNTCGQLTVVAHASGALPVRLDYHVVEEAVYAAMYGASAAGPLQSTTAGRALDVTAAGNAGIDWANVENPTTAVDLSATDIQLADTVTTLTGHTAQTGDSFARIGAAGAGLTAIDLPNQTMDITGSLSGSVGSVTGAVGSVAGNVDGNVSGTVLLANGAHGGAAAAITLADYSDFTGAGATNPNVLLTAEIATVSTQTEFTLATGSDEDDAYNDQAIVLYDDSNSDYPSVRKISNYVGATLTVTIDSAPDFTLGTDDSVRVFVTAPGTTAPTVGEIQAELEENGASHLDTLVDRVTAAVATASALTIAQNDLDLLTGADGVTLATSQGNYAPATATALATHDGKLDTAQSDLDTLTGADGATLATSQGLYAPAKASDVPTATEVVDEWETQSQADPTGFHVNVLEIGGTTQTANDNGLDINAIVAKLPSKTYLAGSTDADGGVDATELAVIVAGVATEISDALTVDTVADLSNGAPPTTPTRDQMWMYLYSALINAIDVDATLMEFYNGAGTLIWKKTPADDGSNYTETKGVAGA